MKIVNLLLGCHSSFAIDESDEVVDALKINSKENWKKKTLKEVNILLLCVNQFVIVEKKIVHNLNVFCHFNH
jgi:hypothetical protein